MQTTNPNRHTLFPVVSSLLVLLGALGAACGDEEPPDPMMPGPGLLVIDRDFSDFGLLLVGQTSAEAVFTIRNAGPDALDGLDARLESDAFTVLGTTCVGWLAASQTCTVTVAFTPAQVGTVLGDLVVTADGAEARASLAGIGAARVRLTNTAASNPIVVSEPAGIRCGSTCEAIFTVPEIVLSIPDGAFATWSGLCETTRGGPCRLRLEGETSVALLDATSAVEWLTTGPLVHQVLIDAENNVIVTGGGAPTVSKLSPAGEVVWQVDGLGSAIAAAVDAQGNIALANYAGVWKLDGAGNTLWGPVPVDPITEIRGVELDPAGNLYVTGMQPSATSTGRVVQLVKYDSDGNSLWSRTYAPATDSEVLDLAVDGDGNAILCGFENPTPVEAGLTGQFLRKYDGDGNVLWTDENVSITGFELAVDGAGNIFLADRIGGGVPGSYTIQKYTPDGALLWSMHGNDIGGLVSGLAVTATGDVLAVGTRYDAENNAVGVWAAKFDGSDGTRRLPIVIQLAGDRQFGRAIAVDGNGDVLLAGGEELPWLRKYDGAVFDQLDE
jgi:hypothetical protein